MTPGLAPGTPMTGADDEIIPTAIVIKNIPFNVKRETLLDIIVRAFSLDSERFDSSRFVLHRLRCPFQRPMHLTTILTNPASSEVSLLPTSDKPQMRMLLWRR